MVNDMTEHRHDEQSAAGTAPAYPSAAKQPYRTPQLIDYGTVAELTQGGAGTRTDGHPVKKFVAP